MEEVSCNDDHLALESTLPPCSGPPPPGEVCQYHGLAFVSCDDPDFENNTTMKKEKCQGIFQVNLFHIL